MHRNSMLLCPAPQAFLCSPRRRVTIVSGVFRVFCQSRSIFAVLCFTNCTLLKNFNSKERFHGADQTEHGERQCQKAAAPAHDPRRCGSGGQPAVQHRGPYLYRPYCGHWRGGADGCGPVCPHPNAAQRVCHAHRRGRRAPHGHRAGAGQQRRSRKDHRQQLYHAAVFCRGAYHRVLCRGSHPAAALWCQRGHPALRAGLQPHLYPGLGLCPPRHGHEPLYHHPGLC